MTALPVLDNARPIALNRHVLPFERDKNAL